MEGTGEELERHAVIYTRLSRAHEHSVGSLESQEVAVRERAAVLGLPVRRVVSEGAAVPRTTPPPEGSRWSPRESPAQPFGVSVN
jgi:hypothetical protein